MQLNPSEISELIKNRIQSLDAGAQMRTQGTVVTVTQMKSAKTAAWAKSVALMFIALSPKRS